MILSTVIPESASSKHVAFGNEVSSRIYRGNDAVYVEGL